MEIVTIQCPKCKGEIYVDQTTEKCFCMYCRAEVVVKKRSGGESATLTSLIKKGFLSLEYAEWSKALEVFDQASNIDPEHGQIYVGKLLAELRIKDEKELAHHASSLSGYTNYQRAIRFADVELRERLEGYESEIRQRISVANVAEGLRNVAVFKEVQPVQKVVVVDHTMPRNGRPINKWLALMLCYPFGILGAHKFYEGKTGMGILYLCTLGLFGIGMIVDFFIILFKPNPYYV